MGEESGHLLPVSVLLPRPDDPPPPTASPPPPCCAFRGLGRTTCCCLSSCLFTLLLLLAPPSGSVSLASSSASESGCWGARCFLAMSGLGEAVEDLRAATCRFGRELFLPVGPAEWDLWVLTIGVRPGPPLDKPLSTLLVMLRGLTALVGLATTACVGVFGVDAILAVTAATITSLFFCPPPSGRGLVFGSLEVEDWSCCRDRAAFRRFSMLVGMELRGPEIMGSSLRGGEGPGAMSGELSDSGTGFSRLCKRLECMDEKDGSIEDSQSEISWTSSWSSERIPLSVLPLFE